MKRPAVSAPPASLDAAAAERWTKVLPILAARGDVDLDLLATYCQTWVRWRKAEETLAKTGPLIKNPRGGAAASPMIGIARHAGADVERLERRLGLTQSEPATAVGDLEDPPARKRPGLFTRPELAEAFGVHQQTITKWERDGLPIEIRGSRGRSTLYSLAACVQWRIERELQARGVDAAALSPQHERALLDRKRREDLEVRMRVRAGELVNVDAVRLEYVNIATAVKAKLRAIPDAIAEQIAGASAAGPAATKALLARSIDDALRELARTPRLDGSQDDDADDADAAPHAVAS